MLSLPHVPPTNVKKEERVREKCWLPSVLVLTATQGRRTRFALQVEMATEHIGWMSLRETSAGHLCKAA